MIDFCSRMKEIAYMFIIGTVHKHKQVEFGRIGYGMLLLVSKDDLLSRIDFVFCGSGHSLFIDCLSRWTFVGFAVI